MPDADFGENGYRSPEQVVAMTLKRLYPQNPDIVFGREARIIVAALTEAGLVIIHDEPDHFVTFDQDGWFIEHSVACRVAGTLGTCAYNAAIREIAEDFDPDADPEQLGRWRITNIDSEGLPSLTRSDLSLNDLADLAFGSLPGSDFGRKGDHGSAPSPPGSLREPT